MYKKVCFFAIVCVFTQSLTALEFHYNTCFISEDELLVIIKGEDEFLSLYLYNIQSKVSVEIAKNFLGTFLFAHGSNSDNILFYSYEKSIDLHNASWYYYNKTVIEKIPNSHYMGDGIKSPVFLPDCDIIVFLEATDMKKKSALIHFYDLSSMRLLNSIDTNKDYFLTETIRNYNLNIGSYGIHFKCKDGINYFVCVLKREQKLFNRIISQITYGDSAITDLILIDLDNKKIVETIELPKGGSYFQIFKDDTIPIFNVIIYRISNKYQIMQFQVKDGKIEFINETSDLHDHHPNSHIYFPSMEYAILCCIGCNNYYLLDTSNLDEIKIESNLTMSVSSDIEFKENTSIIYTTSLSKIGIVSKEVIKIFDTDSHELIHEILPTSLCQASRL